MRDSVGWLLCPFHSRQLHANHFIKSWMGASPGPALPALSDPTGVKPGDVETPIFVFDGCVLLAANNNKGKVTMGGCS